MKAEKTDAYIVVRLRPNGHGKTQRLLSGLITQYLACALPAHTVVMVSSVQRARELAQRLAEMGKSQRVNTNTDSGSTIVEFGLGTTVEFTMAGRVIDWRGHGL